ncbi:MAG: cysteine desulfurase family protein [Nanoarchaeota archaeon]|nr:cysteine desulfurase family protein [Nanoarchaeota archaeon]
MKEIYLDSASTTPVSKEVIKEMNNIHLKEYGNASSQHALGEKAEKIVLESRKKIAQEINSKPYEIIFTSGTTESDNLAFFGLAKKHKTKRKILISSIEHSSIFEICDALSKEGYEIIEIPVDSKGFVDLGFIEKNVDKSTLIVSVIHANNEIGVVQDLEKIGKICKLKNVYFHSDCAQSFGKIKIDVKRDNISLLSAGAHKLNGPKGIGFLYLHSGIEIEPLIYGGGQERGLRGGTENVASIAGFAKSIEICHKLDGKKIKKLRDYFILELEKIDGKINGDRHKRLDNNISVSFSGIDGESLTAFLSHKGIYVSSGSACDSKKKNESRVLRAIGLDANYRKGTIRISLNRDISKKEIDFVVREIKQIVGKLRM